MPAMEKFYNEEFDTFIKNHCPLANLAVVATGHNWSVGTCVKCHNDKKQKTCLQVDMYRKTLAKSLCNRRKLSNMKVAMLEKDLSEYKVLIDPSVD